MKKRAKDHPGLPLPADHGRPPDGWAPPELPDLSDEPVLRADFETTGLRWWAGDRPVGLAVWAPRRKRGYYFGFAHLGGGNLPEDQVLAWMASPQGLRGKRVVNLNTRFDVHMSRTLGEQYDWREVCRELGDVAHYQALIDDQRREFSLNSIARDVLGPAHQKKDLPPGYKIHELPAWVVEPYGVQDVRLVDEIGQVQSYLLREMNLGAVRTLEDENIPVTVEMEQHGFPLDWEKLERWCAETEQDVLRSVWRLHQLTGLRVEPDSQPSCLELFKKLGIDPPPDPETGRPTFAVKEIKRFAAREEIQLLIRAKVVRSWRSKYYVKYRDGRSGDVLRYALHQLRTDEGGTVSGRYSSTGISKETGEGANVQQVISADKQQDAWAEAGLEGEVPWPVRELFVAPPGEKVFAADAKQIQLRIFAAMAKNPEVLAAYAADPRGTDYHDVVQEMAKKYMRRIRDLIEAGNLKRARKLIKNTNFALTFGAQPPKIAEMNEMSVDDGYDFVREYKRAFPEVDREITQAMNQAEVYGQVRTRLGRRTTFPGGRLAHKGLNAIVQGGEADYVKMVQRDLYRARKRFGVTIRVNNHDELVGSIKDEGLLPQLQAFLDEQRWDPRGVPIVWDAGVGDSWRDA